MEKNCGLKKDRYFFAASLLLYKNGNHFLNIWYPHYYGSYELLTLHGDPGSSEKPNRYPKLDSDLYRPVKSALNLDIPIDASAMR